MPPDVFSKDQQFTHTIEEGGGMQTPSLSEDLLLLPQANRELTKQFRLDLEIGVRPRETTHPNGLDRRLSAYSATGSGEEVALVCFDGQRLAGELYIDDVVAAAHLRNGPHCGDLTRRFDKPFSPQKSGSKFFVLARSSHGDCERSARDTDF